MYSSISFLSSEVMVVQKRQFGNGNKKTHPVRCICYISSTSITVSGYMVLSNIYIYMLNFTIMDLIYNVSIIPGMLTYFVWKKLQFAVRNYILYWKTSVYGLYLYGLLHGCMAG